MTGIDISKLKANGSHYAVVGFTLPIQLDLPADDYETVIEMQGKEIVVQIQLTKGQAGYLPDLPMPVVDATPTPETHKKPIHYTSFVVFIPCRLTNPEDNRNYDKVWHFLRDDRIKFCLAAVSAVNNLIRVYRLETGENNVKPISSSDAMYRYDFAFIFNKNDPNDIFSEFIAVAVPTFSNDFVFKKVINVPDEAALRIRQALAQGCKVSLADELMLNAHDFLEQGNYRLAVIEAETAFENAVYQYLLDYYAADPITVAKVRKERSFTNLIKHRESERALDLSKKDFFSKDISRGRTSAGKNYMLWETHVWGVRGDIVHGRIVSTTHAQAAKAVEVVEDLLFLLLGRPKTVLKRYSKVSFT